jgi:DNA modification methylase
MIKILQGNCIDKIKELDDNSIDCVVSSPPYFGLRDYGVDGQFGLEKSYKDYLANTVKVFETFKPKLKDTATIWWNVGDSYHNYRPTNNKQGMYKKPDYPKQSIAGNRQDLPKHSLKRNQRYQEIKEKDLMMIPNRVAIALQDAGWYIRSEIIWHKPNPMPESVRDRPTSCHEKIWLITKNKKYYYDHEAIKEPITDTTAIRLLQKNIDNQKGSSRANGGMKSNGNMKAIGRKKFDKNMGGSGTSFVDHSGYKKADGTYMINPTRNKRNVWTITTKPFKDAHFATFPKDLIEPCIKAGCPEGGVVLDPFGGSGTTGIVAALNNRNAILIELNQNYIDIANKRIDKEVGLFSG